MLDKILTKIFGSANERRLKKLWPIVAEINRLEERIKKLSDDELRAKTAEFRNKIDQGATLDELLPEAFAVVREASVRTTGMRHFDVQLIGGMVLHQGCIAEMRTGEGKTLVATLPVYLNALEGKGVHVVTVNDYLARRDAEWMGKIYKFLGLTVGCIQHDMGDFQRQEAYNADVTYGTNNEFGFDYLRDNMKFDLSTCVQRGHHYAIVDEVDSILIDEARTPLIISGASEESTEKYYLANDVIPKLKRDVDYQVDEKAHTASLTEEGIEKAEKILGCGNLYDPANMEILHCVNQALKAHTLYHRDKDYIVKDGEVIIVDSFTGRLMPGRRWSDGLHQAVEAKEGVKIERETQTLATITLQNYFRMYEKLAGMTGTAETEAEEFAKIYNLDVVVIPTHRPMIRQDLPDVIYRTQEEKWDAVVEDIVAVHKTGQPVLVGTVSVENSELLSARLKKLGIKHNVLNAKPENAAREAEIVAQAGRRGAVTIATNMAGRGTDILLGGNPEFLAREILKKQEINPDEATAEQFAKALEEAKKITEAEHREVVELGGLYIIGTERHESRRIDNQLRGRAGRQGDPGRSRFYLSLQDDLMRIFGGERVQKLMLTLGMEKGVAIESRLVSKRIEAAQKSVEGHNFGIRKHLLEYDDVLNRQRETIYGLRRELLEDGTARQFINVAEDLFNDIVDQLVGNDLSPEEWNFPALKMRLRELFAYDAEQEGVKLETLSADEIKEQIWPVIRSRYQDKEQLVGADFLRHYERMIMLEVVDQQWKDHLTSVEHLKEGIGLRGYGQKDPLVEYKRETKLLFDEMIDRIDEETCRILFNLRFVKQEEQPPPPPRLHPRRRTPLVFTKANSSAMPAGEEPAKPKTIVHTQPKVGRNEACPCGSGKKYKKCCGANA
ncbi:MAG: preprotein translocase subunit SecA [Acidobacteriota bacterium]|nr:preprotein translocase subunit SecA [Blastocatellia bacterium]MDW8412009.1 preprotein translocase subunit SecA [Acidobacteriota bacterium]